MCFGTSPEEIEELRKAIEKAKKRAEEIKKLGPVLRWVYERPTIIRRPKLLPYPPQLTPTSMMVLPMVVRGTKTEKEAVAVLDTGSELGSISPRLAEEVGVRDVGTMERVTAIGKGALKIVEVEEIRYKDRLTRRPRLLLSPAFEEVGVDLLAGWKLLQELELIKL